MVNLSGLSGLSAVNPGYQQSLGNEYKLDDLKRAELAKVAMGNALSMLAGGGQGNAVPGGPQPPPPGAPSQPMQQAGGAPPGPPQGGGMPPPGGMPMQPPMPQRPPMPPMGGPPGPGAAPPQMQPPGGMPQMGAMQPGPQGMGGRQPMDWRQIVAAVKQANPNLPPDVMAEAVNQFLPMMNAQSQQEWRQISLQLREQSLQERMQQFLLAEAGRDKRSEETIAGRKDVAETQVAGRKDVAETGAASREKVAGERLQQSEQHFQQREARLGEALKLREDSTWARLEQQKQAAVERAQQSKGKQGLAAIRAIIDEQDKHLRTRIQAYSVTNQLKPDERKKLLDQADMEYNEQIQKLRAQFGNSTPTGGTTDTAKPKVGDKAPATSAVPGTPPPTDAPPIAMLKKGTITTFENGQRWTIGDDGQPKQVP